MESLEWIILLTDHFSKARAFYKNTLKLKVLREIPKESFVQFQLNNCFLALYGRRAYTELVGEKYVGKAGGAIFTFAETVDVDTLYNELVRRGVKFIKKPQTQPWGQRTAYFIDPDGHIWEIQKWLKKSL